MEKFCPRCKVNILDPIDALNAVSRRDNETYICSDCGTDEALIDCFDMEEDLSWLGEVVKNGNG